MSPESISNLKQHAALYASALQQENIGQISKLGAGELFIENSAQPLRNLLVNKIKSRVPFSYVRLGDGEGNCLFWGFDNWRYPELSDSCMSKIWNLMFGNVPRGHEDYARLAELISSAMLSSDVLGVHTDRQFANAIDKCINQTPNLDLRGMTGVLAVRDSVFKNREHLVSRGVGITSCHSHKWIAGFFKDLVEMADNLSVITCYPQLLPALHRACNIGRGREYLIPPQALNIRATPVEKHYPDVFERLSNELSSSDLSGRLFFVGAGLLGKVYCNQIKEAGGMAIDVGSMMDVWIGKGVRAYQDHEFLSTHALSK